MKKSIQKHIFYNTNGIQQRTYTLKDEEDYVSKLLQGTFVPITIPDKHGGL